MCPGSPGRLSAVSPIPRWPAVIFDLDGTLVDTIPLILASFEHTLGTVLGSPRPEAEVRPWIGRRLGEVFETEYPERAAELEETYVAWNRANAARLIGRFAGIPELLGALAQAQVRTGVATSKRRETTAEALEISGLTDLVDVAATAEDTTAHKPDPAPLLHAAARLSMPVQRCVYVGDAVVDVQAAQAAGMAAIAVTWGAGIRDSLAAAKPDHLVGTPEELRAILLPPQR